MKTDPKELIKTAEKELKIFEATAAIRKEYGENPSGAEETFTNMDLSRVSFSIADAEVVVFGSKLEAMRVRLENVKQRLEAGSGPQEIKKQA